MLEREIKLAFNSPEEARAAVTGARASPLHARRLQQDTLFDNSDGVLQQRRCALRLRREGGRTLVTFKGPPQPVGPTGPQDPPYTMKLREEHETAVDDGEALERVLEGLGLIPAFRYEKYREEYAGPDVIIAIDETPVGTFVEIEGSEAGIIAAAGALGRSPDDFIVESYRGLFLSRRDRFGIAGNDMVFGTR